MDKEELGEEACVKRALATLGGNIRVNKLLAWVQVRFSFLLHMRRCALPGSGDRSPFLIVRICVHRVAMGRVVLGSLGDCRASLSETCPSPPSR